MSDFANLTWLWVAIAALVILAIIAAVMAGQRRKKLDAARHEATELRERAHGGESYVAGAEDRARDLQSQAREARDRAAHLEQQADDATRVARDHRDRITDDYVQADEIDPDVKR